MYMYKSMDDEKNDPFGWAPFPQGRTFKTIFEEDKSDNMVIIPMSHAKYQHSGLEASEIIFQISF